MSPLALSAQPSPSSHLPPVPLPPPDSSVEKPGLVQCRSVFTGQPASSARTPLQCVPRSGLLSRVCEFVTSQRLFCGVWYRGERNIGKMTCTILLVTLMMVCTVSFIYGTQSDSVLKEVLSATGNSPRLHKTRDGSDKYGRFRKALVRKSRNDYTADPPAPTYPPIGPCTSTSQACAELQRFQGRTTKWSYCKCEDGAPDCDETWMIGNDNSVTFKRKDNGDTVYQLKFCRNLPDHKKCPSNFGMTHSGSVTAKATVDGTVIQKWIFNPVCKCPFNYFVEYEHKHIRDWTWDRSFTCYKPIEACIHDRQVCGIMTRVSGGTPSFDSMCKCNSLTSGDCSQTWEDDRVTWTAMHNYNVEYQYKFCVELPRLSSCYGNPSGKAAGMLTSTSTSTGAEVIVYTPKCECRNKKIVLYEVNKTNNTVTFVCDKGVGFSNGICAIRYKDYGGQEVDIIRYIRICPESSAQKCLKPEKDGSLETDTNGHYTVSRCIEI